MGPEINRNAAKANDAAEDLFPERMELFLGKSRFL
jgi:hypothetical protein